MFLCTKLTHLDFIVSFFLLMCNSISLKMNKFLKIKVLRKALFAFASLMALVGASSVFVSCHESLEKEEVNSNPNLKAFKEAAFSFAYILRSHKDAKQVLFSITITPKDYEKSLMPIKP